MKKIILCADDYGQNTSISQAIITLIDKKRLSATSCMTTTALWATAAKDLEPYRNKIDIGLHFNLTEGMGFTPLSKLLVKANLRRLNQNEIEKELHLQLDRFSSMMGQLPDFIDGHQHVHLLPIIRDAVVSVYDDRLRQNGTYIRSIDTPGSLFKVGRQAYLKRLVLQLCGAHVFHRLLEKQRIPHNTTFSGIYDFSQAHEYIRYFQQFLKTVKRGGLIMCHPGLDTSKDSDAIAASRCYENNYFLSDTFLQDCDRQKVSIARFYQCK